MDSWRASEACTKSGYIMFAVISLIIAITVQGQLILEQAEVFFVKTDHFPPSMNYSIRPGMATW